MNEILGRYWKAYGGFRALLRSPYLWFSFTLTLILYPTWSATEWWTDVISIIPSLLGFSLGGYAMWLAIGDDDFRKLISGEEADGTSSPYMEVNATFVHFIFLQLISLILALIAKAFAFELPKDHFLIVHLGDYFWAMCKAGYFISYFVFIYAVMTILAATLALFRVSSWYDMAQTKKQKNKQ